MCARAVPVQRCTATCSNTLTHQPTPSKNTPCQLQVKTADAPAAAASAAAAPAAKQQGGGAEEIYIGFAKGDTAPRAGRKGRVVRDDPRKYPAKEDLGVFAGATGGWAGGEAGLWKLREEVLAQKRQQAQQQQAAAPGAAAAGAAPMVPKPQGAGRQPIYVGHGKYDADLRRAGAPGRFVLDDPKKYPAKEDVGPLLGATGGFAAGEKGVKQFVRDGELRLRRAGEPGGQRGSPVAFAGLLALAGAGGGLLLNGAADLTEGGIRAEIVDVSPLAHWLISCDGWAEQLWLWLWREEGGSLACLLLVVVRFGKLLPPFLLGTPPLLLHSPLPSINSTSHTAAHTHTHAHAHTHTFAGADRREHQDAAARRRRAPRHRRRARGRPRRRRVARRARRERRAAPRAARRLLAGRLPRGARDPRALGFCVE